MTTRHVKWSCCKLSDGFDQSKCLCKGFRMPLYTYRREDGTTFDIRQGFTDEPLTIDNATGQRVVRVIQPAPIIFKGSGFYVNDSRGKTNSTLNAPNGTNGKKAEGGETAEAAAPAAATPAPAAESSTPAAPAPAPTKPAAAG
jgi:predicted nucleic acid-binding Zn ribbon protein